MAAAATSQRRRLVHLGASALGGGPLSTATQSCVDSASPMSVLASKREALMSEPGSCCGDAGWLAGGAGLTGAASVTGVGAAGTLAAGAATAGAASAGGSSR